MCVNIALTYVDLDDDADSLDVAVDTPPPASAGSHSKMAADMAGSQTPADILSPAEEKPPPGNNKPFQDGRRPGGITDTGRRPFSGRGETPAR